MITDAMVEQYHRDGFIVVPHVFSSEEVEQYKAYFMAWNETRNPQFAHLNPDPLVNYPRIMQPHRADDLSLAWVLDDRLDQCMTALLGQSPYAVQTMFYFKPAGARGQALHQDQFYLRVQPGTCMAAWMAIDPCDEENGCLQVVPGTHTLPTLCTVDADPTVSFSDVTVELPEGMSPLPVIMQPGDVLFFNGQLVHGSYPNTSIDRFRRSFIGHYIVAEAEKVGQYYHPVYRMDGTHLELGVSEDGGPCGVWVDEHGVPVVKLEGV